MRTTATMTRERLEALQERRTKAREAKAKARKLIEGAKRTNDDDLLKTAEANFQQAWDEEEVVSALEKHELMRAVGSAPDFGAELRNNVEALQTLREIAATQAP